jgi:hypothetical protein
MKNRTFRLVALVPVLALGPIAAQAEEPVLVESGSFGGHFYEVYSADGFSWEEANDKATALTHDGVTGHLATITTAGEDLFLNGLRQDSGVSPSEVWVGGFQVACAPGSGPTCGWNWVNGEGPIDGTNAGPGYANWLDGEPNDNTGPGSESFMGIGLGNAFGWNDEAALGNIGGYIVEYTPPTVIDAADCTASAGGCETIEGQTLILPAGFTPPEGSTLAVSSTQFVDNLSLCAGPGGSLEPRVLFDGALTIPAIFCAFKEVSPGAFQPRPYIVVKTTANFAIPQGTVSVVNDTSEILADNYGCTLPVVGDPQHQQVVLWQSTDRTKMLENTHPEVGVLAGAAGDYTTGCGSTRGAVRGSSYHVIGMSIFTGQSYTLNPLFVFDQLVALTRYQLVLSREAIEAAKSGGAVKQGDYQKMASQVDNAIKALDRGKYGTALTHVDNFVKFAASAKYVVTDYNHSGELQSRSLHNQFMLREKIVAAPYTE